MSLGTSVIRWESTSDPSRWGLEIAHQALLHPRTEVGVGKRTNDTPVAPPTFVFAALHSVRSDEVAGAISQASKLARGTRIFIAVDQDFLSAMDAEFLTDHRVGIVLDHVNSHTPLSAVCGELIAAVRFDDCFIQLACEDGRTACILDTMLRLTHDLGLATLATHAVRGCSSAGFEFDYVATPAAPSEQAVLMAKPLREAHTVAR